jgi:hypothetical protein
MTLDQAELAPCYEYCFQHVFDVTLTVAQQEALFVSFVKYCLAPKLADLLTVPTRLLQQHLMDVDGDSSLGFAEFVM